MQQAGDSEVSPQPQGRSEITSKKQQAGSDQHRIEWHTQSRAQTNIGTKCWASIQCLDRIQCWWVWGGPSRGCPGSQRLLVQPELCQHCLKTSVWQIAASRQEQWNKTDLSGCVTEHYSGRNTVHHLSSSFSNNPWFCKRLYPSVCVASEMLAQLSGERLKQDPNYEKKDGSELWRVLCEAMRFTNEVLQQLLCEWLWQEMCRNRSLAGCNSWILSVCCSFWNISNYSSVCIALASLLASLCLK